MMKQSTIQDFAQLFLRIAIGFGFFFYGSDRLGLWGKYGDKNVSWGDWSHFMAYASQVMRFIPYSLAEIFAAIATAGEITFGILLIIGYKTKWAALGTFLLAGLFAISMTISFGVFKPLAYSVFTVSAGGLLLYCTGRYRWSLDALRH